MQNSNLAEYLLNAPDLLHCQQLALPTPQAMQGWLAALQSMALRPGQAALPPVLTE